MELSNSFGVKETFINRIFWGLESTLPPNLFVVKINFHTLLLIDSIWFTTWYGPRFVITVTKTCSFGSKGIPPKHGHPNMFEIGCNWVKYDQLYSSLLNIYIYMYMYICNYICIYTPEVWHSAPETFASWEPTFQNRKVCFQGRFLLVLGRVFMY